MTRRGDEATTGGLLGRQAEVDELAGALERARLGRGGLWVVVGEAGIGKTRLCDEVGARGAAGGFGVHWGRAWETGGAPAYWPWVQVLESLRDAGALVPAETPAEVTRLLSRSIEPGPAGADPAQARFALFDAVAGVLRRAALARPRLVVLDDLHAADRPSVELADFVGGAVTTAPLLLLATMRDAEGAEALARLRRNAQVIALGRLGRDDVASMIAVETGRDDDALVDSLLTVTEGNPLFLHEVLRWRTGRPDAALFDRSGRATVDGIIAVIEERLAAVPEPLRALLAPAAVLGRELDPAVLALVAERPRTTVTEDLAELSRHGLLVRRGEDRWAFSHVLVCDAVYRALPAARRRRLHAAVAEALAGRVELGESSLLAPAAHHALEALPDGDAARAVERAGRAADQAMAQLAFEEAAQLRARALDAAVAAGLPGAVQAEELLALGWAAVHAGQPERAHASFARVTELARHLGDASLLARAALGHGAEILPGSFRGELVALLGEALDALGDLDLRLRARVMARLAAALQPREGPDRPIEMAREAIALAREVGDERTQIEVLATAGSALVDTGIVEERVVLSHELARRARAAGDPVLELRGLTRAVVDLLELGDTARADAALERREALGRALRVPRHRWQSPVLRSMRHALAGRFADCEECVHEARRIVEEGECPGAADMIVLHRFALAWLADRTPDLAALEPAAMEVVERSSLARRWGAWLSAAAGGRRGDAAIVRRAIDGLGDEMTSRTLTPGWRASLAESMLLVGETGRLGELREALLPDEEHFAGWGYCLMAGPPVASALGAIAGALGEPDEAEAWFARALGMVERTRAVALQAWVRFWRGRALAGAHRPGAREELDRAADLAATLGMPGLEARCRSLEAEGKRPPASARATAAVPGTLSFELRPEGEGFRLEREGRVSVLKRSRGLEVLAVLLSQPGREIHALELLGGKDTGDAGALLDDQAVRDYRERLDDLRDQIEEAESFADAGRASRARAEKEALEQELARAIGLGGRGRRAGAAAERARLAITRRLRNAIQSIRVVDPEVGRHLEWAIRTGTFCAYEPEGAR